MIRQPAVAGSFYPRREAALRQVVRSLLSSAKAQGPAPKAIIVPHAALPYSGAVAALAYASLGVARAAIRRIILLGPAHYVGLRGVAATSAEAFATPLGSVPVDQAAASLVTTLPQGCLLDAAHAPEHSLEVQLPFLQELLDPFILVPLVVGHATPKAVGEVLDVLWGTPETRIVVSSDLSHYHDDSTARKLDQDTASAIERLAPEAITPDRACGQTAINGLLWSARRHDLKATTLSLRTSADAGGPSDCVVGYGAFLFHPASDDAERTVNRGRFLSEG